MRFSAALNLILKSLNRSNNQFLVFEVGITPLTSSSGVVITFLPLYAPLSVTLKYVFLGLSINNKSLNRHFNLWLHILFICLSSYVLFVRNITTDWHFYCITFYCVTALEDSLYIFYPYFCLFVFLIVNMFVYLFVSLFPYLSITLHLWTVCPCITYQGLPWYHIFKVEF